MPAPIILGGLAVAGAVTGAKKAIDGFSSMSDAKDIATISESRLRIAREELNTLRTEANEELKRLGKLKLDINQNQIKHIVDILRTMKQTNSEMFNFHEILTDEEVKQMEEAVSTSFEIQTGLMSGASAGVLAGLGAYGSVGMLASASTGTAISTLSGAAATNATLAWLGGGSLAAGGLGMAGGTLVLGGLVTAPALAITGFHLASKGEEAMTEAREYEKKNDLLVAKIDTMKAEVKGIIIASLEQQAVLLETVKRFENGIKVSDNLNQEKFTTMCAVGKSLKAMMEEKVLEKDGTPTTNMRSRCEGHIKL